MTNEGNSETSVHDSDPEKGLVELLRGAGRELQSGFERLVRNYGGNSLWFNYCGEKVPIHHLRQTVIGAILEWETPPVNVRPGRNIVNFVFAGSFGNVSQPQTDGYEFLVNGKALVEFDLVRRVQTWQAADRKVILLFSPRWNSSEDISGFFFVAVSRELLVPGRRCRFAVRSKGCDSKRWFAICPVNNADDLHFEAD